MIEGQTGSGLCCQGRSADVPGEEFPSITMSNDCQLTILGCTKTMRNCIPQAYRRQSKWSLFFLLESTRKVGTGKKNFPLVVYAHCFSCFLGEVIKKKKYRCADSLLSHDSVSSLFVCYFFPFFLTIYIKCWQTELSDLPFECRCIQVPSGSSSLF